MSGYPYDTATSFVRHPAGYAHDAFGHFAGDDVGVRSACFRKIPHTGLDVSPKKIGDTSARVVAPVPGTIVASGVDAESGLYVIIKHDFYEEWWLGGHHSRFIKRVGHVERGEHIADMGASGGAAGVHAHWSVATSLAAALDQVRGYVNYRNGRTVAAWAATEGLVDPWPLIEREWAAEVRESAAAAAATAAAATAAALAEAEAEAHRIAEAIQREEEEVAAAADSIKAVVRRENRPRLKRNAQTGEVMLVKVETGFVEVWHPGDRPGWADELTRNFEAIVTHEEVARMPDVDPAQWALLIRLAEDQLARIAAAAAAALAK